MRCIPRYRVAKFVSPEQAECAKILERLGQEMCVASWLCSKGRQAAHLEMEALIARAHTHTHTDTHTYDCAAASIQHVAETFSALFLLFLSVLLS